ncbi:MAG TPA: STAS domain-containing protein [Casimicrobiaceae bacterium]|jgi:anti-anti-sigma regulatory factor
MAFNLFPKSPVKGKAEGKPRPDAGARSDARSPPGSARELAATMKGRPSAQAKGEPRAAAADSEREITVTGPPSLIEWTGLNQKIQVAEANPGLCAVLENAALLYANGQAPHARAVLEDGVANDGDAKVSPLAWLALFDLLQRAGDHVAYEQLSLQYVVAFERSAPSREELGTQSRRGSRPVAAGYVGLTGKLNAGHAPQIANLLAASQKQPQLRLDLGSLTGADDAGAKLLADALEQLRKRRFPLALQHPEKIRNALEHSVARGRDAGEGYWILLLELLQWQNDHKVFEDRAVEFAVAFEVSPPSWEPPPSTLPADPAGEAPLPSDGPSGNPEMLVWQGSLTGSSDPQLARLATFGDGRHAVPIDMAGIDRIDFVCAGALFNAISRAESQRKSVQIVGASPIIRALLLLIGISPRHFIKKAT